MKTRLLVLGFAALCLSAAPVMAEPPSVQDILNGITTGPNDGVSHVTVGVDEVVSDAYWQGTASGGSVATMVIEVAGWSGTNSFGLFDSGSAATLVVFDGPDSAGVNSGRATIYFDTNGDVTSVALNGDVHMANFKGSMFGFFLDARIGSGNSNSFFYSDTTKNADNFDHMWAYAGENDTVKLTAQLLPRTWTPNEYILAFEDTFGGGDQDHNDLVVMVESVKPVPVPAALLLGFLGLGAAGLKLRRFV